MYHHNVPAIKYSEPWNIPLEYRLKALERGHRRVAYIYLLPDPHVFRYRVYNMVQALQRSERGTAAAYFTENDLSAMDRVADCADVIVVCRTKYDSQLNHIITRARSKGKVVFFDVDDLIFDVKYTHLILSTHDLDRNDPVTWDNWFAHIGRLSATMQLCERAITTNRYLAGYLQPYFPNEVFVIPNFLNREQMEISERIYKSKRFANFARTPQIHLGYFSGTPSHDKDFAVAGDALLKVLEENPQVVLRVVGPMKINGPLQNYSSQIERYPLQDFVNLQRLIGQVEVNLVPLQDNEFTNCKSELKFFEAGIVGTVTLATPTYSFAGAIQHGTNGFLAQSYEWYEKIQQVLALITKTNAVDIAENAMLYSELHYAWDKQTRLIEDILFRDSPISTPPGGGERMGLAIQEKPSPPAEMNGDLADKLQLQQLKYDRLRREMNERHAILLLLESQLAEIRGSRAWKAIDRYRSIRMKILPPGSIQELPYKFLGGILFRPGETVSKTFRKIQQSLSESGRKVKKVQDELIRKNFGNDTRKLIVFLVPGANSINGGTMSICSLAKVSIGLKPIHNSEVLIATLPGSHLFTKYTFFDNPFDIYRFEQLYSYFTDIEELTIHLPEAFVGHFLAVLTEPERIFLKNVPRLRINILNQNVWLMPSRDIIALLKQFTDLVTCTTAHSKYCTEESREYYGIPFHYFSASNLTDYFYSPYQNKENLMVISHDKHKDKERILARLQSEHPEIALKKIENTAYEDYKRLLSRAKWAITFGEGIDGYFVESIRSGAIPFAVYNKDFFSDPFRNLPNVYQSYEELYDHISEDLKEMDEASIFENLSKRLIELDKKEYDDEKYKDNVRRYYMGEYDLP